MKTLMIAFLALAGMALAQYPPAQPQPKPKPKPPIKRQMKRQMPQPAVFKINASDFAFSPNVLRVKAGTMVRVRLLNTSQHPHSIRFDLPGTDKMLHHSLRYRQTGTLSFRAPREGTYEFWCPVGDHAQRGMRGQLIVMAGIG